MKFGYLIYVLVLHTEYEIYTFQVYGLSAPDDKLNAKRCNNNIYSHESNTKC